MKLKLKVNLVILLACLSIVISQSQTISAHSEESCKPIDTTNEIIHWVGGNCNKEVNVDNLEVNNMNKILSSKATLTADKKLVKEDVKYDGKNIDGLSSLKIIGDIIKNAKAFEVEELLGGVSLLSIEEVAQLVADGYFGNGANRKLNLEDEGYDYEEVQLAVDNMKPKVAQAVKSAEAPAAKTIEAPATSGNVVTAYPHGTFKSYMAWTTLSSSSSQGKLSAKATPDPSTAIMTYEGRYLVALGFAYADHVGQHIDVVMSSGKVIPAIVGDFKAINHTDQWNSASLNNGSIIEFIVSSNSAAGSATNGSGSYDTLFPGTIKEFIKR